MAGRLFIAIFAKKFPMPLTPEEHLHERIKELSCLYTMSTIFLKGGPAHSTFTEISHIVRAAWRYPEDAVVSLTVDEITIETDAIPASSIFQRCPIIVFKETRGQISVHYDSEKHSERAFLEDELRLLQKVAFEVAAFYEKHLRDEELVLLKRSAERSDRLSILGEITAGIAHELNTPLGNILGFAELIAERAADQQTEQDIAKVIKAAIYSREIVKKLMFFTCEMPQHMQSVKIKPVVEQALTLLEPNFRKGGIISELIMQEDIEAQLDPIQFTQVLFNILVNAIYVSKQGSSIITKIYSDQASLFITISDEGPGIVPEIERKIFEPFFTTKPFGEGNGLGLSVVHGIIKSHQGEISTFANHPQGTTFKIQLPLKHQS